MKFNLSIIIPHYNSSASLKKLLDSIGYHEDVQIIVVDDRSEKEQDAFTSLMKDYTGDQFIFCINDRKKGAGTCRNIGLSMATGKWLLFADADDYFCDNWYTVASSYFDSEYDTVYFDPTSIDLNTGKISNRNKMYSEFVDEYDPSDLRSVVRIKYYWCVPWSKMIRTSIVKENNISFSEVLYSNDVMFSAKAGYYSHNIHVDRTIIYVVTDNEGTLTKNISEEAFFIRVDEEFSRFRFLKKNLSSDEKKHLDYREGSRRLLMVHNNKYGIMAWFKCLGKVIKNGYPLYSKRQ